MRIWLVVRPYLEKISDLIDAAPQAAWNRLPTDVRSKLEGLKGKIDDALHSASNFSKHIDVFVSLDRGKFQVWKNGLIREGFSSDEISEIIYLGSLERGENIWGNDWKKYYEQISGTTFPGPPYHAHHLVEKRGGGEFGEINREILSEVGIDPFLARENLTWAPNVTGQHGADAQNELTERLLPVRGDKNRIIQVLKDWAEIARAR